ncbi:MAG: efflux RND transporter permease subunit [Gammaproteobacteria bacterium]
MADQEKHFSSPVNYDAHSLGIAGRTARLFITSPVTPMLLMVALLVGLVGLLFTPRQEDPQISVPMIDVFVRYEGATAEQVASLVTEPLERLLLEIPGVRHTYTGTMRGQSIVTVRFKVGEDMGESVVKVHDKLQSNMDRIPPNVSQPLVKPVGVDDVPVVTLTLWSSDVDDGSLRLLALDLLQRLGAVKNVGKGFVVGGREDQVKVEVMPERLSGYGISMQQVAQTIQTANAEKSAGGVESSGTAFEVRTGSFLTTPKEIGRLVIGIRNGAPVYVRDVARVSQEPAEPNQLVTFFTGPAYSEDTALADGESAVTVAIAKKEGSNGVEVAKAVLAEVEALRGEGGFIPANVNVMVTRDYGKSANDKVNDLLGAMMEACVIVAFLCLIGLGFRAAFVVITIIPVVILLTIWWAMMVDYTIDRVSLFALIFAIGILVDDATVVVENIFRHWLQKGKTSVATAIDAVREVGNPTILATFTIIAALLPMGFVSGLMGPYMRPIPVLGSSAMFFSLVAAFIFTPWFAVKVAPKLKALERAEAKEKKAHERISRMYRPIIMPLIENRFLGVSFLIGIIAITALLCITFYTQTVPVKMLPFDNKPEFTVIVNMPEGTALPDTANVTLALADKVREIPEVTNVVTYAGTAQPFNFNGMVRHYYLRQKSWEGDLLVMLTDKKERERGSHEIAVVARNLLKPVADEMGARIAVVEMPPGPPVLQTIVAEVYGPDPATRRQVATDLMAMFEEVDNVVDVDSYMAEPYEYWGFEVDTEKAVRRGVSVDTVNGTLAMAMGSFRLGDIKRGTVLEPTYIVLQIPLSVRSQISRLGDLPVPTADGSTIPLSELGQFRKGYEEAVIYTKDLREIEYVVGEMEGRLGAPIYGMLGIEDLVEQYTTPDGVNMETMPKTILGKPGEWTIAGERGTPNRSGYEWTGEWTVTYETFRDMGGAFIAALILIYGLIVWEFKNFALAGLIMSPIPVTMMGIIPGHWIMGAEFTATSMIGMIALGGIIVRQSILIVEFVKLEVAQGKDVTEAAVRGAELRMRPIFITSATLMAGAFAIIDDPIFNGMAISLMFGAGVATVMALLIIPLGCISAKKQFYIETADDGSVFVNPAFERIEHVSPTAESVSSGPGFFMKIWGGIISGLVWVFYIIRAMFTMIMMGFKGVLGKFTRRGGGGTPPPPREPSPGGGTPPPPRGGGTPPPPREVPVTGKGGTPPPPREVPVTAKGGTPPPPREVPVTATGGTPPPPREVPVTATGGTPPPPREVPVTAADETAPPLHEASVTAADETAPPPHEASVAAEDETAPPLHEVPVMAADENPPPGQAPATLAANVSDIQADSEEQEDDDTTDIVGRKRRGIRLKQDLT